MPRRSADRVHDRQRLLDFAEVVADVWGEPDQALARRSDDAALLELLGPLARVAGGRRGRENPGAQRLGRRDPPAPLAQAVPERRRELENAAENGRGADLGEQVERSGKTDDVVGRQGPRLVTPGARVRRGAAREVVALDLQVP